jgi:hypothetical protein
MNQRAMAIAACLVLSIITAGCSESESPSPAVTQAAPTPSVSATTPAALLTLEQAAAEYRRIVAPSNAANEEANNLVSVGKWKEGCQYRIESKQAFDDALKSTAWPVEAQRTALRLAEAGEKEVAAYRACAAAATDADAEIAFVDLYPQTAIDETTQLANTLRTILGLPPVS